MAAHMQYFAEKLTVARDFLARSGLVRTAQS